MEALNEYTATAIENETAMFIVPGIRAVHEREAAAIAVNIMAFEGFGCNPNTEIALSELFSSRTHTATIAEWSSRPD